MKLSELIAKVGDENTKIQSLDDCTIKANYDHKKGTTILFGTNQRLDLYGTIDQGVIVWLPRDKVKAVLDATKPSEAAMTPQVESHGTGITALRREGEGK